MMVPDIFSSIAIWSRPGLAAFFMFTGAAKFVLPISILLDFPS